MRKVLACILFLLTFCSFASGESMAGFNDPGCDALGYACTLPDGRKIFTGYRGEVGNYQKSKARLLCLNPDRTISWEMSNMIGGYSSMNVLLLERLTAFTCFVSPSAR